MLYNYIRKKLNPGYQLMLEGIHLAEDHADERWKAECKNVVLEIAQKYQTDFILDEVLGIVASRGFTTKKHNAFGGIVRRLVKEGRLRPTGAYRASTSKVAHCRAMRVYDYVW